MRLLLTLLLLCTVYLTEWRFQADFVVYLSDWKSDDTAGGLFDGCSVTDSYSAADYKIHLTNQRSSADLIVYKGEFL